MALCQQMGARGFQKLKIALAQELVSAVQFIHEDLERGDETEAIVQKIFASNVQALEDTLGALDGAQMARALASCTEAMVKELKLEIAKLRRGKYGISSERRARLIDQLELQLEELEATATEDALAPQQAAQDEKISTVRAFTQRPVLEPRTAQVLRAGRYRRERAQEQACA